jgi:hypothetical protein
MKNYSNEFKEYLIKYSGSIILYPKGYNNLCDLFNSNIVPKVINSNINLENLFDVFNTVEVLNESFRLIKSEHIAKWSYYHYNLLTIVNTLGLEEYLDNDVSPNYIYDAIISHISNTLDNPSVKYQNKTYNHFVTMMEEEEVVEIMLSDLNGDFLIDGFKISELINIFIESENNVEKIKNKISIIKGVENF